MKRLIMAIMFLAATVLIFGSTASMAQSDYPTKQIALVSPWPPGHQCSLFCQLLVDYAPKYLGQRMDVLCKSGGGAVIGTNFVAKAPPDGYTIGEGSIAQWGVRELTGDIPYSHKELDLICSMVAYEGLLVVRADKPWANLKDYMAAAKTAKPPFKYGHVAKGGHLHLLHEELNYQAGVKMIDVPIEGGDQIVVNILSDTLQSGVLSYTQVQAQVEAKKLKILAALSNERSQQAPDVPCMKESGYENKIGNVRWAFFAPAKTPEPILAKLEKAFKAIYDDPEFQARAQKMNAVLHWEGRQEVNKKFPQEREVISLLLKKLGLHKEK